MLDARELVIVYRIYYILLLFLNATITTAITLAQRPYPSSDLLT